MKKNYEDDGYEQWYEDWSNGDLSFEEIKEGYRKYYGEAYADMLDDESFEHDDDFDPEDPEVHEVTTRPLPRPRKDPTEFFRTLDREERRQQRRRSWRNLVHDTANVLIWSVFIAIAVAIAIWIKGE